MQYFFDTEFIEDGVVIDLVSIGIVADDGRELYQVSTQFNPGKASKWVKDNVFPHLPPMQCGVKFGTIWGDLVNLVRPGTYWRPRRINPTDPSVSPTDKIASCAWHSRAAIAHHVRWFCSDSPEFWAEWGSYDWVAFCQLFGTMMDLPKGFPMRVNDVIQWAEAHLGLKAEDLPESLETEGNHNALLGAKTVKARWEFCANCLKPDKL